MKERERKTAYAWDHIKQAGSTFAKRGDTLLPGYRELKRMGVVTINGPHVQLTGDYRRAFLAGEDLPSWADLSVAVPTTRQHATKKSRVQLDREIAEALSRMAEGPSISASEAAKDFPRDLVTSLARHGVRIVGANVYPDSQHERTYLLDDNGRERAWTRDQVMKAGQQAFESIASEGRYKRELRQHRRRSAR